MNVLGGYQKINLSPADLTASTLRLDGLSKACANANGKAVLVKMPNGTESFGAVKGVTGGYQLSVMGADSKVSTFSVDDTDDTFTMSTGEETSAGETETYLDSAVDFTSSTSAAPYTAAYDGIATVGYTGADAAAANIDLLAKAGATGSSTATICRVPAGATSGTRPSVFVKKGTKLYLDGSPANTTARFYPYKPVQ